jgi:hypothetical protein
MPLRLESAAEQVNPVRFEGRSGGPSSISYRVYDVLGVSGGRNVGIGDCYAEKDEREARNLARDRGQLPVPE